MKNFSFFSSFCLGILSFNPVFANEADIVLGFYMPPEKKSIVEIFKCEEKYCGRTVCLKNNVYLETEKDKGVPGTPYLDHNNEDPKLRTRPSLGKVNLMRFEYIGEGVYKNGRVYNPHDGKTYCGRLTVLEGGKRLDLKGTLCSVTFLGKTMTWSKVENLSEVTSSWYCTFKKKK
ncbi:DUF2147 domain-containing protein [Leptospira sp. 96542]|nr:DUF2147 domain-containing protein [Leptospira sp. 96542]